MTDSERQYYEDLCEAARKTYERQQIEYRATGTYTKSTDILKLEGVNVWVRSAWHEKNGLEREIAGYDTVSFPKRPPEFDEQYERQLEYSKIRRKLKIKGLLNDDGTWKEGAVDFLKKEGASEYLEKFQGKRGLSLFQHNNSPEPSENGSDSAE